jgi:signal transduction histidine kinase
MPALRLTAALTLGVGATLVVTDVALSAHLTRAVEAERVHELEVVSRQVRAVATGLTPELGSRRAASAASEGLEAAYSGGWRWLELAATDELLSPAERDLLRRGELVLRRSAPDGLLMLTALPQASEGDRLVLELRSSLSGTRPTSTNALLLGSLLGIGLVSTIAATLGHLLVTRPLRRISAFVQQVESGDRATRLAEDGAGEVVLLERALNRLCDRLDATDRSLREQVRAAAKSAEDLRHADRLASVGKLSAGIAHELGTPLNVILVRAKAIARAPDDPAETSRQAVIVATQAERLIKIVRGLLDFSRRRPPHLAPVDLGDVVRGVVSLLEPQARGADVELRQDVAAPLPLVQADAGQVEQVEGLGGWRETGHDPETRCASSASATTRSATRASCGSSPSAAESSASSARTAGSSSPVLVRTGRRRPRRPALRAAHVGRSRLRPSPKPPSSSTRSWIARSRGRRRPRRRPLRAAHVGRGRLRPSPKQSSSTTS